VRFNGEDLYQVRGESDARELPASIGSWYMLGSKVVARSAVGGHVVNAKSEFEIDFNSATNSTLAPLAGWSLLRANKTRVVIFAQIPAYDAGSVYGIRGAISGSGAPVVFRYSNTIQNGDFKTAATARNTLSWGEEAYIDSVCSQCSASPSYASNGVGFDAELARNGVNWFKFDAYVDLPVGQAIDFKIVKFTGSNGNPAWESDVPTPGFATNNHVAKAGFITRVVYNIASADWQQL
jgi:hypothetical protein